MEKYSQFRDKGSGVAPFFPIPREPSGLYLPIYCFFFVTRLIFLIPTTLCYFLIFSWLPVGSLVKKAILWILLGIPGIWWIDLQIDGVKRGSLAKHKNRLPQPSTLIASSFTSPLDCLYLAAIFDPVFTASYPHTRMVQPISLFQAIYRALVGPMTVPPPGARLVPLSTLLKENPDSIIVVLPECTTSNGRAILPLSPSLLSAPPRTKVYPVNLRYSPADITTPIPGAFVSFLWALLSRPTHAIRVRIAEPVILPNGRSGSYDASFSSAETLTNDDGDVIGGDEGRVLDGIADDLARLGRAKRVGLGVREKVEFVKMWTKTRTIW